LSHVGEGNRKLPLRKWVMIVTAVVIVIGLLLMLFPIFPLLFDNHEGTEVYVSTTGLVLGVGLGYNPSRHCVVFFLSDALTNVSRDLFVQGSTGCLPAK